MITLKINHLAPPSHVRLITVVSHRQPHAINRPWPSALEPSYPAGHRVVRCSRVPLAQPPQTVVALGIVSTPHGAIPSCGAAGSSLSGDYDTSKVPDTTNGCNCVRADDSVARPARKVPEAGVAIS